MLSPQMKVARAAIKRNQVPVAQTFVAFVGLLFVSLTIVGQPRSVDAEQRNGSAASKQELPMTLDVARRICADKKVAIEQVSQMKKFIYIVTQLDTSVCSERYVSSVAELDGLLKIRPERLCEPQSIDAIADYHFRFIAPRREIRSKLAPGQTRLPTEIVREQLHPEPSRYSIQLDDYDEALIIPIALRHFFLKWVLQVSGQCKRDLLDNLKRDETCLDLKDDDKALMALFDRESPLGALLAKDMELINFENVVYMPELEGKREDMKKSDLANGRQVHIKSTAGEGSSLFELAVACQARLKPIYEQIVMPIVKLGKLGYDYLGEQLSEDELAQLNGSKVKSWLGIVHVCEMFDKVLVVDEPPKLTREPSQAESDAESDAELEDVVEMSDDEVERLKNKPVRQILAEPIKFKASQRCRLALGELWIKDERQLDLELSKKPGNKSPFGFTGFLRRTRKAIRRELSKLDFKRFAHYRRHSAWYSGVLNFISSCSNVASITVTLVFTFAFISVSG